MSIETASVIAANRFGLGARPGELAKLGSLQSAQAWLKSQLSGQPPLLASAVLKSTREILAGAAELATERREAGRDAKDDLKLAATDSTDPAAAAAARQQLLAMKLPRYYRPIYIADAHARLQSAITTDRPFVERLVHFWSNHFAVSVDKIVVLGIAGSMEREAIRPQVLGSFAEMLLAVEKHPAMLLFLDNAQSVGPDSMLARRISQRGTQRNRQLGLNENLAREILELHTLGVDGGYSQADVTSFAKVITGWSAGVQRAALARFEAAASGEFMFRDLIHEPGAQTVVGKRYAQGGMAQGEAVLRDLAASEKTARHLATKLARHFIADEPPASVVQNLTNAYLKSGGDLPTVYAALIEAPEAWSETTPKYKTPLDYVHSIYRGLQLPLPEGQQALAALQLLGQQQFLPGSPAGWPDRSVDWDGSAALMKRIELASSVAQKVGGRVNAATLAPQLLGGALTAATAQSIARAESGPQALTLLLTAPEFLRR
jgi:uncharacterized protein (DUF1800 family)